MNDAPPPATIELDVSADSRGTTVALTPKTPVPLWRWMLWSVLLAVAVVVFYGIFALVWFSLRVIAWAAEFRARRRRQITE